MNKQEIISNLKDTSRELSELLDNIAKSPSMKEEGRLISRSARGKTRLYEKSGSTDHYLSAKAKKKIVLLATKGYAVRLDKAARLEKTQIERCLAILGSGVDIHGVDKADIDLVYGQLPDHIKSNTIPSMKTDDGYAERWQKEKYNRRWTKGADTLFETPRGEKVRSKSEWMIACMLADAGVPYRYEETVPLSTDFMVFAYPDFTVLNKRTRKVYCWEHFGMMSDPDYVVNNFLPKISDYYNFEFLPGERLLMTFESKERPLDTVQVKRIIEKYLI